MKGSKKITFLEHILKVEAKKPGPSDYSPDKIKHKVLGGLILKEPKLPTFLGDAEYMGLTAPTSQT
jgi:hypothetical protein